jgi:hypothetical protein
VQWDWHSGKGIGMARILLPGEYGTADVYVSHLQAQYADPPHDEYAAQRVLQAFEAAVFIRSTRRSDLTLLLADLNSGPDTLTYRVVTTLAGFRDAYSCTHTREDELLHGGTLTATRARTGDVLPSATMEASRMVRSIYDSTFGSEHNTFSHHFNAGGSGAARRRAQSGVVSEGRCDAGSLGLLREGADDRAAAGLSAAVPSADAEEDEETKKSRWFCCRPLSSKPPSCDVNARLDYILFGTGSVSWPFTVAPFSVSLLHRTWHVLDSDIRLTHYLTTPDGREINLSDHSGVYAELACVILAPTLSAAPGSTSSAALLSGRSSASAAPSAAPLFGDTLHAGSHSVAPSVDTATATTPAAAAGFQVGLQLSPLHQLQLRQGQAARLQAAVAAGSAAAARSDVHDSSGESAVSSSSGSASAAPSTLTLGPADGSGEDAADSASGSLRARGRAPSIRVCRSCSELSGSAGLKEAEGDAACGACSAAGDPAAAATRTRRGSDASTILRRANSEGRLLAARQPSLSTSAASSAPGLAASEAMLREALLAAGVPWERCAAFLPAELSLPDDGAAAAPSVQRLASREPAAAGKIAANAGRTVSPAGDGPASAALPGSASPGGHALQRTRSHSWSGELAGADGPAAPGSPARAAAAPAPAAAASAAGSTQGASGTDSRTAPARQAAIVGRRGAAGRLYHQISGSVASAASIATPLARMVTKPLLALTQWDAFSALAVKPLLDVAHKQALAARQRLGPGLEGSGSSASLVRAGGEAGAASAGGSAGSASAGASWQSVLQETHAVVAAGLQQQRELRAQQIWRGNCIALFGLVLALSAWRHSIARHDGAAAVGASDAALCCAGFMWAYSIILNTKTLPTAVARLAVLVISGLVIMWATYAYAGWAGLLQSVGSGVSTLGVLVYFMGAFLSSRECRDYQRALAQVRILMDRPPAVMA